MEDFPTEERGATPRSAAPLEELLGRRLAGCETDLDGIASILKDVLGRLEEQDGRLALLAEAIAAPSPRVLRRLRLALPDAPERGAA